MRVVADGRDAVDTVARDATQGLHQGESLLVHTRSGQALSMVYQRTDGDALVGKTDGADTRVAVAEVVRIERQENDGWKTAGLVGGIVALVLGLAVATANGISHDIGNAINGKGKR